MKKILVELDDRIARDLARVAPTKERKRAEFIRIAIRRAVDLALDRETVEAYVAQPLESRRLTDADLVGWDLANELAVHERTGSRTKKTRASKRASTRAA
ncbi:MAG TPA: hypothetical protein VF407_07110 [Polyangiaceae bacterium]